MRWLQKPMKCILVSVYGGTRTSGSLGCSNVFEPIGLLYLASWVEQSCGVDVDVIQQNDMSEEKLVQAILDSSPDLVGFTTLTVTINPILRMAAAIKSRAPGTVIVLGGEHATAAPELASRPEVDFVVRGEGEKPFAALIEHLEGRRDIGRVPSISYAQDTLVDNSDDETGLKVDDLPVPKRYERLLESCRIGGLMHPYMTHQRSVAIVAASRGCPNNCMFCTNELMWKRKLRLRTPARVVDELERLHVEFGTNTVFFSDLSFNASSKYTISLCRELKERRLPIRWYAMCNLHRMTEEVADAMAEAGCGKIGFGIESILPESMSLAKTGISLALDETNRMLEGVNARGVFTKAYFIIGFPWDTRSDLERSSALLPDLAAHEIRIGYFVPFMGTKGYKKYRGLVEDWNYDNWSCLDGPVVSNSTMTKSEIV